VHRAGCIGFMQFVYTTVCTYYIRTEIRVCLARAVRSTSLINMKRAEAPPTPWRNPVKVLHITTTQDFFLGIAKGLSHKLPQRLSTVWSNMLVDVTSSPGSTV